MPLSARDPDRPHNRPLATADARFGRGAAD